MRTPEAESSSLRDNDTARFPSAQSAGSGNARLTWTLFGTIVGFSLLTVYSAYLFLNVSDLGTGVYYAEASLQEYRDALSGTRSFPFQWRLLGIYLVYVGERLTATDPNLVDACVKVVLLCFSSTMLFLFSRFYVDASGALCAVALYHVLTIVGFSDGYSIYYTNDYAVIATCFAAVYLARVKRFYAAIALTFLGAFAKETALMIPILIGCAAFRRDASIGVAVAAALAFAIPSAVLRVIYPAPFVQWAWWHMALTNIPFLQASLSELLVTLKNTLKVALYFNVLWVLAARGVRRSSDPFVRDLAIAAAVYIMLAYPVIVIRELRHFLPLAILVLPLGIAELTRSRSVKA